MLGLFDSGLGGLTVLRRLRMQLPQHDFLFFADQANVPYGDKSPAELSELLVQNLAFLNERGAEAIVMACNTSCATAATRGWPPSRATIVDLIDSAALEVERGGYKRIGVIATTATARAGAYTRRIRERIPHAEVYEVAAPALVPLVEAGKLEGEEPRAAVAEVCAELPKDVDAVILACTHYPLLDAHFAAALPANVARLDPAIVQAERTAAIVAERGLAPGTGEITAVTSGNVAAFRTVLLQTLGAAQLSVAQC